ncbi:MAG TPA: alpha/beta hydrolase [Solirubrobacteraceae bacterium]|nr:alpha/beta hydrolase [Solirubrobacteraceae bacterium]
METVISSDGTRIAYDRSGEGPTVILVNGALGYRKFKTMEQIAMALSERCTVINYDRRGRGDSGPAGPASVEREIDDLAALIETVGGRASLWGYSSGSAVALRAAAAGVGVEKLMLYETPFKTDPDAKFPRDDYAARLEPLIAADDRMGAARHFLRNVGMPGPIVSVMSLMPMFKRFGSNGHTLMFDYLALGDQNMHGSPLRAEEWASVTCPTLVVYGSKTYPSLKHASRSLAEVLPNATLRELPGQKHAVKPSAIAPLIAEFVAEAAPAAPVREAANPVPAGI